MVKAMWIAVLTYFGLIAIAAPVVVESGINWVDVDPSDWAGRIDEGDDTPWHMLTHAEYVAEYSAEFDEIFAAVEFKRAKNGRSMTKSTNGGGFKFAPKSK